MHASRWPRSRFLLGPRREEGVLLPLPATRPAASGSAEDGFSSLRYASGGSDLRVPHRLQRLPGRRWLQELWSGSNMSISGCFGKSSIVRFGVRHTSGRAPVLLHSRHFRSVKCSSNTQPNSGYPLFYGESSVRSFDKAFVEHPTEQNVPCSPVWTRLDPLTCQ